MSWNKNARPAAKRALAAVTLAMGTLAGLGAGNALAIPGPVAPLTPSIPIPPPSPGNSNSGGQSSVNGIKIGNRSQFIEREHDAWYDVVGPPVG